MSITGFVANERVRSKNSLSFPLMIVSSNADTFFGVSWTGAWTGAGGGGGIGVVKAVAAAATAGLAVTGAEALGAVATGCDEAEAEAMSSSREVAASRLYGDGQSRWLNLRKGHPDRFMIVAKECNPCVLAIVRCYDDEIQEYRQGG